MKATAKQLEGILKSILDGKSLEKKLESTVELIKSFELPGFKRFCSDLEQLPRVVRSLKKKYVPFRSISELADWLEKEEDMEVEIKVKKKSFVKEKKG